MTDGPTNPMPGAPVSLVDRVKNILTTPKTEWARIDTEPASVSSIYSSYVLILAAIGPIAGLIGQQVFGIGAFGISWKPSIAYSVGSAVFAYVISLVVVYVLGIIIDALATSFGGTKDSLKAFKVAAYSMTPGWVGGIFSIIPMLAWIGMLFGLYGLYLLYLGIPRLMKAPEDKAVIYTVVVVVAYIVLFAIALFIVGALVATFFGAAMMTAPTVRY